MDWHSTRGREELLIALSGVVQLELGSPRRSPRRFTLRAGSCTWLAPRTLHRVINRASKTAHYLYITAGMSSSSQ